MNDPATASGWRGFWSRGGLWWAVLLAGVYLALYLGAGRLIGGVFGDRVDRQDLFSSPGSVFFGLTAGLLVGSAILAAFVISVGWFRPLFARQPVRGSWWMWIAPLIVVAAIVLRLLGIDYTRYSGAVVALSLFTGLFIGFAEEILTRGIVVKMLRDAGKSEWVVMVLSSLVFALLHASNVFSGMPVLTVALTLAFTFGFGVLMYLTLRVTGNLIWPMLIHGMYDPSLFLATGGIDEAHSGTDSVFLVLAGPANIVIVLVAVVALVLVRGRAQPDPSRVDRSPLPS